MVFYFTATGNSLYVAKRLDDAPRSIPQCIHADSMVYADDVIGFVCPVFAGELPNIVMDFLKKATFKASYIYFILTYGNDATDAPEWTSRKCEELGIHVNYIATICMVDNYLPVFDMNEQVKLDKKIEAQMQEICASVAEKKQEIPSATRKDRRLHKMVRFMYKVRPSMGNGSLISINDNCVGCQICTKVCPVGNFEIENNRAVRKQQTCEFCLACAHHCPQKAIYIERAERNPNARYRNEHITLDEIVEANCQLRN